MGNPNHDSKGRFSSGGGGGGSSNGTPRLRAHHEKMQMKAMTKMTNAAESRIRKAKAEDRARISGSINAHSGYYAVSRGKRAPNPANKASKYARAKFPYSNISAGDLANRASGKARAQLSPRGRSTAGELAALRSTPGRAQIPGAAYGWSHANRRVGMASAPRTRGFDRTPRRY